MNSDGFYGADQSDFNEFYKGFDNDFTDFSDAEDPLDNPFIGVRLNTQMLYEEVSWYSGLFLPLV